MDKDTMVKAKFYDIFVFQFWYKLILGLIGIAAGFLIWLFQKIWADTVLVILVLWGFILLLVLAWLVIRTINKAKDRRQGTTLVAEADAWRLPGSGTK
ncbi:MAG TPA: hypothetical protein DCR44_01265 [Acholeplasmatales bacterium]|nr:hypothetical protein [Acholeplasmatales bacterium]